MSDMRSLLQKCINTIRFLSVDAIQKARSGHPGLPMGTAALGFVLWARHLKFNPANPLWSDRDRFILSAGHGSMLLYSLLYLTGYDLTLEDLRNFRQWDSRTPGHPEHGKTPGVEVTTGPLGQGLANAVGMALAESYLAERFNRPGFPVVDHRTYVLASDGDMMEGVGAEACSLAGHLGLGKLIVLYDQNGISLAGATDLSFTEDVTRRFASYNWHVVEVDDGNDLEALDRAVEEAREETLKPSLIAVKTILGYGSPGKGNTYHAHGAPLGEEEVRAAKENLGWPVSPDFHVPEDVIAFMHRAVDRGKAWESDWRALFSRYAAEFPPLAQEFERMTRGDLPANWKSGIPSFQEVKKAMATRKASEEVLQYLGSVLPELIGGSADLNPSCFTWLKGHGDFQRPHPVREGREKSGDVPRDSQGAVGGCWDYGGRNIHYGVREHAMGAISVGMGLHGGVRPFTGTFFVFSDYMRPPVRLASLMGVPVIFVFTHDSIGVGEDGPTHQPVEQLMNLRSVPRLTVIRPGDSPETAAAWEAAVANREGPTVLVLTRQNVPVIDRSACAPAENLRRGGYVLWESGGGHPSVILIGTGSELHMALEAGHRLSQEGVSVRVVSLPSWELFDAQEQAYRDTVLPPDVRARVAVEAGIRIGWEHYVGLGGAVVGLDDFGASAPADVLYEKFGITVENVMVAARKVLNQ